jgi:hypothetical protein
MSLNVIVTDKIKNQVINKERPHILIDDNLKAVKDKLFAFDGDYIPNLLKLEYKNNEGEFILITQDLFKYNLDEFYPTIYVTKLLDEISNYDFTTVYISNNIDVLLKTLKDSYIDLKEDDLHFVIDFAIIQTDIELGKNLEDNINNYLEENDAKRDILIKKYTNEEENVILKKFYELSSVYKLDLDNYVDIEKISYSDVSLIIKGKNIDNNIFIKIQSVFNVFELSQSIPFIALSKKQVQADIKEPLIKIHDSLIEQVSSKEIKGWVLNEKKKLNQASYKIIKGLMIKSKWVSSSATNFLTINIMPNGIIYVNIKFPEGDQQNNLNEIIEEIKENIDNVITILNEIGGIFLHSKRIAAIKDSDIIIESINTIITTNFFIDRRLFSNLVKQKIIFDNLLELKQTESLDILSLYYKKINREDSDIKGLTINIKDNPIRLDSSIITIFGAENIRQAQVITTLILILNDLVQNETSLFKEIERKRKIKEKSKKKLLKESGVNFDSRTCQGDRVPILIPEQDYDPWNKSTLKVDDKIYKCKEDDIYKYPGFTKYDTICCFKNNQIGNETYIRNMDADSLNILVQPSNKQIIIQTEKGSLFKSYALKVYDYDYDYDYGNEGSLPSTSIYFYINEENKLVQINDAKIIKELNDQDNIWLDVVTLSQILYPSSTKHCNFQPDLSNRKTLNSPCENQPDHKYFGYSSKSIPCCFDKERDQEISRKKKDTDITKQYIITSDKLLNYQKIGVLPEQISILFNKLNIEEDLNFYRMGIIQNNSAFLNAILLGVNDPSINGIYDFKRIVSEYLKQNPIEFKKANNGNLAVKYRSIDNYLNYIGNKNNIIHWYEIIDILEKVVNHNIIILDTTDESKIKIKCRPNLKMTSDRTIIILYKKEANKDTFELAIGLKSVDSKNELNKSFEYNSLIVQFLIEYYNNSCVKENQYPDKYSYNPLPTAQEILEKYGDDIKFQIVNSFNRTSLLMKKNNFLIPILETGIIEGVEIMSFSKLIKENKLLSLKNYIDNELFTITGKANTTVPTIGGAMTSFGYIIPYIKTPTDKDYLPELEFIYYLDIDEKLAEFNKISEDSDNIKYIKDIDELNTLLFKIKTIIAQKLSSTKKNYVDVKNYLEEIIKHKDIARINKIDAILFIFNQIKTIKKLENKTKKLDFIFRTIANEMLNDNISNLLLNNIVTSNTFNRNEVVKRENESVLLNIEDIYKWIKQREN